MNTRNLTTRTLSLLLVLLMVFCMVPMQAFAADNAADLPTGSEETVTYSRVTSISNGNEYVITMYSCGLYYVLSHANNTLTPVEITVSDNEIDSEITEDMLWTMKNNKLTYEDGGKTYNLYGKANSLTVSTSKSSKVTFKNCKLKLDTVHLQYANGKLTANTIGTTVNMFAAQ